MITYANLKAAFYSEKEPRQIKRISKGVYKNAVQTFIEILSMTKFNAEYINKYVKVHKLERIEASSKNPNGMILLSAHFDNWELSTVASVYHGYPLYLLARDQKMVKLNELLNRLRESKGNIVIRKGMDIKNLFRILKGGNGVGILADQNAGANGKLINFFGRPASTAVGPYRIAQKCGAWILPAFIHRRKGPYHDLILEEPMVIGKDDDIMPFMEKYSNLLEKHIRDYPDQWLWMHKRWKVTPLKKVLILDDGKRGHLKQSLAVAERIRRYRESENYSPEHLEATVKEVKFKNKLRRTLLSAMAPFFTNRAQGRLGVLRWALEEESYQSLVKVYADVVISCGSALSGVNRLMKIENYARNVTVLDPGFLMRKKFNLVVIPRHDAAVKRDGKDSNIVVTDLAPNLITPEELIRFREKEELSGKLRIGLLLGGDNKFFTFGESLMKTLTEELKKILEGEDAYLYSTTSRRTTEKSEKAMKEAFNSNPRCRMYVSGKLDKDEHTVEKILANSDILVVSGESISMVSEAVSSGKPVIVFMPDKRGAKVTKYERFVKSLEEKDAISLAEPGKIAEEIKAVASGNMVFTLPDDNKRITDKLYRLF